METKMISEAVEAILKTKSTVETIDKMLKVVEAEYNYDNYGLNFKDDLKQLHLLLCDLRRRVEYR